MIAEKIAESLAENTAEAVIAKNLTEERRRMRERGKTWRLIMSVYFLVCIGVLFLHSGAIKRVDLLDSEAAMTTILNNDRLCFAIMLIVCAVFIIMVVRRPIRRADDPMEKVICYFGVGAVIVFIMVFMFAASKNIYSDYKHPSVCSPDEYVLSTYDGNYYIAFKDKGEFAQLVIPEEDYEKLSEGETDGSKSSVLYTMVEEAGYSDPELYSGGDFEIEYYYHSAIFIDIRTSEK